jgi:hypothetical protein
MFGVHSTFDGSMILFEDVIQVLHREPLWSVWSASAA